VVSGPLSGGIDWRAKSLFLGPPPRVNQAPTATIASSSCSVMTCSFDSAGSVDPDGTITAYAWNFGDGGTATTPTATHTYGTPGTYTVTLTVTDNDGVTGTASTTVTAQAPPASTVAFRAAAGANVTFNTVTVNVPAATQVGDAMLLAVSTGQTLTPTVPAGWSQVTTVAAKELTTTVYQRVAVAGDAGSAVRVTIPSSTKLSAQILVYSGTRATSPVTAATTAADIVATTTHTAPAVPVADNGSWVVRLWVDKSSTTTAWTLPAEVTARDTQQGTGTGYLVSVAADGNGSVTAGTAPAVTATTNDAPVKTTMVSLVLAQ
jgi:PKD repeat protein